MKKLSPRNIMDFIVVVLVVIFLASLMTALDAAEPEMTMYEQCQIWNKWAYWPYAGQCPGDLQPRWYR